MAWISVRIGVVGTGLVALVAATLRSPSPALAAHRAGAPKLGHWTSLSGKTNVESGTPAIWQDSKHRAVVLWEHSSGPGSFTYDIAKVSATGTPGATVDAFAGGHWSSLSNEPRLVGAGGKPLVVYTGIMGSGVYSLGCIYGAAGTSQ